MTRFFIIVFSCAMMLAGCSGTKRQSGGGYYKDDGPGSNIPANIEAIPDAVPRIETHAPANLRPYVVFGKRYVPISGNRPFRQVGTASWYGRKFHGNKTANGETYDMYAMTAAHPTLPLPSYARVSHARSGKSIIVRINDRGPFHSSRIIDLSYVAAAKLGLIGPGSGQVIVEAITHADIRNNAYQRSNQPAPKPIPIPAAPPATTPTLITRTSPAQATTSLQPTAASSHPAAATAPASTGPSQPVPDALAALTISTDTGTGNTTIASDTNASTDTAGGGTMTVPGVHAVAHSAPKADSPTQIFLQFGAFSAHENASGLAARLNQEIGHIEHRRAEVSSSADLHRVQIGPYTSRTQAVNAALRIQAETGRKATYAIHNDGQDNTSARSAVSL